MRAVHSSIALMLPLFLSTLFVTSVLSIDTLVVGEKSSNYLRLQFTSVIGPESIAFDPSGRGPYTGVSDGRVLRWDSRLSQWAQFAVPPRPRGVTAAMCNGSNNTALEPKCGRPLGIQFHRSSGYLYVADAYYGLLAVGPQGGLATAVATAAEGVPFNMTNGVDIDQDTGLVYFTDSSTVYQRNQWLWAVLMADNTGRFMSYDPRTKQVTVLLRGLEFPNGVAISEDKSFILIVESTKKRVHRYWIKGPKARTSEVFTTMIGYPDNIRRNAKGEFWVAINSGQGKIESKGDESDAAAIRYDASGKVVGMLYKTSGDSMSEVQEMDGSLYFGSVVTPYLGMYKLLL